MEKSDALLLFAFSLPPEKAIEFLRKKGYKISWDWTDLWQEAHAKAFTVAKVMKLDLLQDIKSEVDKAIQNGMTLEEFRSAVEPIMRLKGWWGKVRASEVPGFEAAPGRDPNKEVLLGSPRRIKTIYRVNMQTSYSTGRYKGLLDLVPYRPYWQYLQIQRKTKRHDHSLLHEKIFMWDDPIWSKVYPPNGFFCGCRVVSLTEAELKERGLKVTKGSEVDFTPDEGWNYNPGEASFTIDESKYYKDLLEKYKSAA
ncbi:MAG: phage head morphogenesis protein [Ignavibacteria bacterium]|jgi:uncharacterized protein with gpF-like domain|nr:phage head morphogenesis protein [Ignavibacteria bacterium]MCU7503808.1 phage head morphogenesis protein [Ignavibacteria bacterium]MCU7517178.1 phage head morphogenesis protein [Ignavibacteria bacterium]